MQELCLVALKRLVGDFDLLPQLPEQQKEKLLDVGVNQIHSKGVKGQVKSTPSTSGELRTSLSLCVLVREQCTGPGKRLKA